MRLSISFSGFGGLADTLPTVMAAEAEGLDGVWTAEHLGFHDAVVPSATYLAQTSRLEIGLVGLSTAARHPAMTAMELMSLSELAPGRVRAQVGLGDDALVGKVGHAIVKPVSATRAFVTSLRETMRGSEMRVQQREFSFDGFRLSPLGPVPPLDVMAIRPKMVQLAAEVGDGLSISVGASEAYLRDTVRDVEHGLTEAGRDRSQFRITALAIAAIGDDLDALRAPFPAMLSMFPQHTAAYLARGVVDAEEAVAVEREQGPFGVMKLWTPERIDQIAMIATPAMLADTLARYADSGIDELGLMLMNPPEQHPDVIRQLAAARP